MLFKLSATCGALLGATTLAPNDRIIVKSVSPPTAEVFLAFPDGSGNVHISLPSKSAHIVSIKCLVLEFINLYSLNICNSSPALIPTTAVIGATLKSIPTNNSPPLSWIFLTFLSLSNKSTTRFDKASKDASYSCLKSLGDKSLFASSISSGGTFPPSKVVNDQAFQVSRSPDFPIRYMS